MLTGGGVHVKSECVSEKLSAYLVNCLLPQQVEQLSIALQYQQAFLVGLRSCQNKYSRPQILFLLLFQAAAVFNCLIWPVCVIG